MESPNERLIRYLDDAWAVEKAQVDMLHEMADEVNDESVRAFFKERAAQTHQQEEDLEARIRALGEEPSGGKGFMNRVMGQIGDALQGAHDDYDKTTQDVMKAYAAASFKMAVYESLEAYASVIGDVETGQLARRMLEQEEQTAQRLWPLIAPSAARAGEAAAHERRAA